ncbi:ferredoxin reductase [Alkanindiges sp. WGS2144]|uniref:ferredoxin reductase n=1 Tax=Alkanindiges sp. WGS2144 TaxID=3366808 RepID=UPI0037538C7D
MSSAVAYRPEWIRQDFVDFVLAKIDPVWAWKRVLARVEHIEYLNDGMVKVVLRPNRHFKTFKPGQFIQLSIRIDGVLHQRCYSIISNPQDNELAIAVKRQGLVSNYLAQQAQRGDVVEISQAQGEFVLPAMAQSLLFIASGSGITPMLPMITQALQQSSQPVSLIYFSRDPAFGQLFEQLQQQYPHFVLHVINTTASTDRLNESTLQHYCADYVSRETFVCGAPLLMKKARKIWGEQQASERLHQESFLPAQPDETSTSTERQPVRFRRSQQDFDATGSLLVSAEQAGLKPAHGCRMGICNTCVCTKLSGTVRNQLTGEINDQSNVQIKLCVSEAISPVEIDL